jgi:hypothetical protein
LHTAFSKAHGAHLGGNRQFELLGSDGNALLRRVQREERDNPLSDETIAAIVQCQLEPVLSIVFN